MIYKIPLFLDNLGCYLQNMRKYNDIEKISTICRQKDVLFHTDATQVVGKVDINLAKLSVDFLSMSAHKIYGPKGTGTAYIGPDDLGLRRKLPRLLDGGDQ